MENAVPTRFEQKHFGIWALAYGVYCVVDFLTTFVPANPHLF